MPKHRFSSIIVGVALVSACAPSNSAETAASPVQGVDRPIEGPRGDVGFGVTLDVRSDDGTVIAKVLAPVPAVWEALTAALADRKVTPTLIDRPAGRIGDTSLVLMRQWNGTQLSQYLNCGSSMTGQRANEEKVNAVLLAQMSRLRADTVAVSVHFSGISTPVASGNGGSQARCTSTGRSEEELLRNMLRRLGIAGSVGRPQ
jgi:hypothetical protein